MHISKSYSTSSSVSRLLRLVAIHGSTVFISHPGQISLLSSAGQEVSTDKGALCALWPGR